jgi:hypothetical protein
MDGETSDQRYKRMCIVAQYIMLAMRPNAQRGAGVLPQNEAIQVKKDFKKRRRLIQALLNTEIVTVGLREKLTQELCLLHYQPSKAGHPWLQRLAHALYQEAGIDDSALLRQVADALTLEGVLNREFGEQTDRRYAKAAAKKKTTPAA